MHDVGGSNAVGTNAGEHLADGVDGVLCELLANNFSNKSSKFFFVGKIQFIL